MKPETYYKSKGYRLIEDPNAPPGVIYFINENYMSFSRIDRRTRWQRIKDWFVRTLRKPWLIL